jgi:hypothetical protein
MKHRDIKQKEIKCDDKVVFVFANKLKEGFVESLNEKTVTVRVTEGGKQYRIKPENLCVIKSPQQTEPQQEQGINE